MWARIGLPATWSRTLGRVWVWGLRRVPTPATGTTATTSAATDRPGRREAPLELVDARDRRGVHAREQCHVQAHVVSELDQRREPRQAALSAALDLVHRRPLPRGELG